MKNELEALRKVSKVAVDFIIENFKDFKTDIGDAGTIEVSIKINNCDEDKHEHDMITVLIIPIEVNNENAFKIDYGTFENCKSPYQCDDIIFTRNIPIKKGE